MKNTILLLLLSFQLGAQDTLKLTKCESSVCYTQFRLVDSTLNISLPGELNTFVVGSPTRFEQKLQFGRQVWGLDSNFYYRIVSINEHIVLEVDMPNYGIHLIYGDSYLLYFADEPAPITAWKAARAKTQVDKARAYLLTLFNSRWGP
jgi:hypothetical protein